MKTEYREIIKHRLYQSLFDTTHCALRSEYHICLDRDNFGFLGFECFFEHVVALLYFPTGLPAYIGRNAFLVPDFHWRNGCIALTVSDHKNIDRVCRFIFQLNHTLVSVLYQICICPCQSRHHRRSCHQKAQKNRTESHRPYYFFPKILHRSNLPADNRCHMLQTELLQK